MATRRDQTDSRDFIAADEIDELFGAANPNVDRIGCPTRATLSALARRERPIGDPGYDHLASCSPCYREFRVLQDAVRMEAGRRVTSRMKWVAVVAAVALLALTGGWLYFSSRGGIEPPPPVVAELQVGLDLRPFAGAAKPARPPGEATARPAARAASRHAPSSRRVGAGLVRPAVARLRLPAAGLGVRFGGDSQLRDDDRGADRFARDSCRRISARCAPARRRLASLSGQGSLIVHSLETQLVVAAMPITAPQGFLKPPLKWAGGKRWQVRHIRPLWEPHRARRFVEPFCGGLAMTLGFVPERALLNDANPHVINFYRWLQRGLTIHIGMENQESLYDQHRARFNALLTDGLDDSAEAAALFYYLNRTAYNASFATKRGSSPLEVRSNGAHCRLSGNLRPSGSPRPGSAPR